MGPDKSKTRLQLTMVTLKTVKKINSHAFMVKNTWKIPMNKKERSNENSRSYPFRMHEDRGAGLKNIKLLGRKYLKF